MVRGIRTVWLLLVLIGCLAPCLAGCALSHDPTGYCLRNPDAGGFCSCVRNPDSGACTLADVASDGTDAASDALTPDASSDAAADQFVPDTGEDVLPDSVPPDDVVVIVDVPDVGTDVVILADVQPDTRPDVVVPPDVQVDVVDVVTADVQDVVVRSDVVDVVIVDAVDAAPEADVIAYPPTISFRQDSEPTFGDYFIRYQLPGDVMTTWSSGHCVGGITVTAGNSRCLLDRDLPVGTHFEFYPVRPGGVRSCDPPSTCAGYSDRFTLTFGGRTYMGSMPPSPIYLFNEVIGPSMLGYFLHVDL